MCYKKSFRRIRMDKESIHKTLSLPLILIYQFYSHKDANSLCSTMNRVVSFAAVIRVVTRHATLLPT